MTPNLNLSLIMKLVDQISGPMGIATRSLEGMERAAKRVQSLDMLGGKMQSFGAGATVAGAVTGAAMLPAIKAFQELEDATTRAQVAFMGTGGVVEPIFKEIADKAVELGNLLPGTTADFVKMASALKETGLSSQAIAKGGLEATSYLSVLMGNLAPEQAAQLVATFKNSLGIAEKDFVAFVDVVQRTKFAFGVDPQGFAETAKYVGNVGQQFGIVGLEGSKSLMTLSGMLAQTGIKGEQLGTSLRGVLLALPDLDKTIAKKGFSDELSKAGVSLQFFKDGKFAGLENLVVQFDKLKVLSSQKRLAFLADAFGTESAPVLAAMIEKGVDGYNDASNKLAAQATMQQRLNAVLGTFASKWDAAMGTLTNLAAQVGATIGDDLKRFADKINEVAGALQGWITRNPELARTILTVLAATAAFLTVVGTGGLILGTLARGLGTVITGFELFATAGRFALMAVTTGLRTMGIAAMTNPVVLIVTAIAVAALLIWKYWEPIKGFFTGLFRGIWEGLKPLHPAIQQLGEYAQRYLGFLAWLWSPVIDAIKEVISWFGQLFEPVADTGKAAESMGERFGLALGGIVSKVAGLAGSLVSSGAALVENLWAGIASKLDSLRGRFSGALQSLRDMLPFSPAKTGPLSDIHKLKFVETIAGSIVPEPLVKAFSGVATAAMAALSPITDVAAGPAMAGVGAARPALEAMVGQQGAAAGGGALSGSVSITINVTVNGGDPAAGNAVANQIRAQAPDIVAALRAQASRDERVAY